MSRKHDYYFKKWQCLIKEYQTSGMTVVEWCAANGVSKHQYYYWLSKIRTECYEEAVTQLPAVKANNKTATPMQLQEGTFVEISKRQIACVQAVQNPNVILGGLTDPRVVKLAQVLQLLGKEITGGAYEQQA